MAPEATIPNREMWLALGLLADIAGAPGASAQEHAVPLPLPAGATVVQTLSFTGGERESFMTLDEVSARGNRYGWRLREVTAAGDTIRGEYGFLEGAPDVVSASRLWYYHSKDEPNEHPGYTMMAISRATYGRLLATGSDTFQVMTRELPPGGGLAAAFGFGAQRGVPTRFRGRLSVVESSPVRFPLLLSGRRVEVPALHLRARLTSRNRNWTPEVWVLADTAYPLILKWIGAFNAPENVLQTVRIDLPVAGRAGHPKAGVSGTLEGALASACRVELPGIYFAFNSAELEPASDPGIAVLADVLARHPDWTATIEGHTDSVGTASANLTLSERRAEALRARLVTAHRVDAGRLDTRGYGSTRPREPNATVEGRARNRRVELVRACPR